MYVTHFACWVFVSLFDFFSNMLCTRITVNYLLLNYSYELTTYMEEKEDINYITLMSYYISPPFFFYVLLQKKKKSSTLIALFKYLFFLCLHILKEMWYYVHNIKFVNKYKMLIDYRVFKFLFNIVSYSMLLFFLLVFWHA